MAGLRNLKNINNNKHMLLQIPDYNPDYRHEKITWRDYLLAFALLALIVWAGFNGLLD